MKRIFLLVFMLALALVLVACGGEKPTTPTGDSGTTPPPEDDPADVGEELVDLLSDDAYRIIYNPAVDGVEELIVDFITDVNAKTGVKMKKGAPSSILKPREIVIGTVTTRTDSQEAYTALSHFDNDDISVFSIGFKDERLIVTASDAQAVEYALTVLSQYIKNGGFKVPRDIDGQLIFDSKKYKENGIIKEYSVAELDATAQLSGVKIDGEALDGFKAGVYEYVGSADYIKGYPRVDAEAYLGGMTVRVDQPSFNNGGVATISVASRDGNVNKEYKVLFIMEESYLTQSTVVNKGGALGTVTIVLDDGNIPTAKYVEELLAKYPEMTVTFAMVTKNAASFELSPDGTEYVRDENGNFVIVQNAEQIAYMQYWQELLKKFPQVEITSHSHTHAYAGEDDTKLYTATDMYGKKYVFPAGSISAEVYGSQQIIKLLFGQNSPGFILPGIPNKESGFSINPWFPLLKSGSYLGARGTTAQTNAAGMVLPYDYVNDATQLWRSKAFMVRYWSMALKENGEFYSDSVDTETILNAGISHATDFIDAAMNNGSWACFCLHTIVDNGASGSHPIYKDQADALFAYANELAKSGEAWVATYGDAITYYCEWADSLAQAVAHTDEYIELSVTTGTKSDFYTLPLTVKVTVPPSWESAVVEADGANTQIAVHTDTDGTRYVLADALPNGETVIIRGVNP